MTRIFFIVRAVPNAFRDRDRLRRWIGRIAAVHRRDVGGLNFVLMSDAELLVYNRRFLHRDYLTDVITFGERTGTAISGDVLMSYDRIRENAKTYDAPYQEEIRRVMAHGLLHLVGFKDNTARERTIMREQEEDALALWAKTGI